MNDAMWSSLSSGVITLAGYALAAGLLVYGMIVGIRVAKSVFRSMAGMSSDEGDYYDDSDDRSEAQAREMFGDGPTPGLMNNGYEDREGYYESADFGEDPED